MTNQVSRRTLGIDVAKHELVIYCWELGDYQRLNNDSASIAGWLDSLHGPQRLAVEPTSEYHLELLEQAMARGHRVYLVNPRQLVHYRDSVNLRHKSDPDDAWLLARFLDREAADLRPVSLPDRKARSLWALLKRRALVVETRKQLRQSLDGLKLPHQALMSQFRCLLARIDRRIRELIQALGWQSHYASCLSVPGIGPVNAAALTCAFHRGHFDRSDTFIAYLGLDIRRRESGRYKGKSKLTKRGEPELRRLLYCAAQPARSHDRFDRYYLAQIDKGLPKTAAKVSLARKLARVAFALMTRNTTFQDNYQHR